MGPEDTIELVLEWLDATGHPTYDEDHERQIVTQARAVAGCMRREGRFFNFSETVAALKVPPSEFLLIKERLYELALHRVLREFTITQKDRSGLRWIARAVHLSEEECRNVERRVGRQVFEQHLSFWMSAGYLDEEELQQVRSLAGSLGRTTREMFLQYLGTSGADFLDRIMTGLTEGEDIPDAAWSRLLATVGALGVEAEVFLERVRPHARRHIEKLLVNVKLGIVNQDNVKPARRLLDHLSKSSNLWTGRPPVNA
jgi:hypothetical protein